MAGQTRPWLLTWERDGHTERRPLDRPVTIGRARNSDIVLDDPAVSRAHCTVTVTDGRPLVDARGSRNGILVDGVRTERTRLAPGQAFGVGSTTFRIVAGPGPARPAAPAPVALPAPEPSSSSRGALPFVAVGIVGLLVVGVFVGRALLGGSGTSPGNADLVGIAPPLVAVAGDWTPVGVGDSGIALRYPPAWHAELPADGSTVLLRQPDSPGDRPVPTIGVSYLPGVPLTRPQPDAGMSTPSPVTVAGLQGVEYHQVGLVVPSAATFIDLPYRGGLLRLTATRGPAVDLVPQLDEIVKTLELAP